MIKLSLKSLSYYLVNVLKIKLNFLSETHEDEFFLLLLFINESLCMYSSFTLRYCVFWLSDNSASYQ